MRFAKTIEISGLRPTHLASFSPFIVCTAKPISDSGLGKNLGLRRRIAELAPKLVHIDAEIMDFMRAVGSPDFLQKLTMREYFSGVLNKNSQHAVLGRS